MEQERFWSLEGIRVDLKREIERSWHSYEASREAVIRYNEVIREGAPPSGEVEMEGDESRVLPDGPGKFAIRLS